MDVSVDGSRRAHRLALATAASLYGLITVGGRYFVSAGFSLLEIAFTGVLFGALLQLPLLGARRRRLDASQVRFFAAFGIVGAGLQLSQFGGIVLGVPVAVVALLLYTQPLWTVLLGRALLGESITAAKLVAASLAVVGVAILAWPDLAGARFSGAGIACALSGGLLLSSWVLFGRVSALRGNDVVVTTFGYMAASTLWLLALTPVIQSLLPQPLVSRLSPQVWASQLVAVAVYTLLGNVLPAWLAMWGVRGLQASSAGVLLLLEPISAALLAAWWFGEPITPAVWAGGILILGSNWVLLSRGEESGHGDS